MKIRTASNVLGVLFALALAGPAMVSCATTSSGGPYGFGGTGGSAGNVGTPGCTKAPDCNSCQGLCAKCTCANGAAQCTSVCQNSGTGGSTNTGGSGVGTGGTQGTPGCSNGTCNKCTGCFDSCMCHGGSSKSCLSACSSGSGGSGQGGSGAGGSGAGGSGAGGSGFGGSGAGGSGAGGSGFGGSSGSSGSGGSGGGTPGCTSQLVGMTCQQLGTGNQTCDSCMQSSCCQQTNACFGDAQCADLYNCVVTSCAGITNQTQFDTCLQNKCSSCIGQQAQTELSNFANCQSNSCGTQCQ